MSTVLEVAPRGLTDKERLKAESKLRSMAFHVAYGTLYANIPDPTIRFAYALIYSNQPIRDAQLVEEWWQFTEGKSMREAMKARRAPSPKVAALIEAYRAAKRKREMMEAETA